MSKFKHGDRVKVEYVATVQRTSSGLDYLNVATDDGEAYCPSAKYLTLIEPEYEVGKYYFDLDGDLFLRMDGKEWREASSGVRYGDHYPARPLRKAVPES